jgi:hypothetical protein
MKRPWVVVLTAVVALGCRSSQPTTNPFLRTTVPPPGTGQGAVVVPGEPYTPGAAPSTLGPGAATAPVVPIDPSAAPIAPPPSGPPVMAPPTTMPPVKDNKYSPPGGSFQYNQSSREPRNLRGSRVAARPVHDEEISDDSDGGLADTAAEPGVANRASRLEDLEFDSVRETVRQVAAGVADEPVELASHEDIDGEISKAAQFGEPVPSHVRATRLATPGAVSSLRVVGSSDDLQPSDDDGATPAATLRITAGGTDPRAVERAQWVVKEPTRP